VRLSITLLLVSLAGVLGGAALIGVAVLGGAVMFVSLCGGVYALGRDDGQGRRGPEAAEPATLHAILERARRAS